MDASKKLMATEMSNLFPNLTFLKILCMLGCLCSSLVSLLPCHSSAKDGAEYPDLVIVYLIKL